VLEVRSVNATQTKSDVHNISTFKKPHGISNPTNAILPLSPVASLMGKGYNEEIIVGPSYSRTLFTKCSPGRLGVARRAEASSISIPCGKKCEAGIVSFTSWHFGLPCILPSPCSYHRSNKNLDRRRVNFFPCQDIKL